MAGEFDHCGPAAAPSAVPAAITAQRQEGATHPDRNAQFEHIKGTADEHLTASEPVISVDTKKEPVGNFKNGGREWQPKGHTTGGTGAFPTTPGTRRFRTAFYDMARNEAWVSVGWDHNTPTFAVASIRHRWQQVGCGAYLKATALFITADAGGSNGYRSHAWEHELQQLVRTALRRVNMHRESLIAVSSGTATTDKARWCPV